MLSDSILRHGGNLKVPRLRPKVGTVLGKLLKFRLRFALRYTYRSRALHAMA